METCVSRFWKQQCLTTLRKRVPKDRYVRTTVNVKGKCSQQTALNLKTRCQAYGFLCIHLRSQKYCWNLPELPIFSFSWKNRSKKHVNLRCPLLSQFLCCKRPFRGGATKESGDARLQVFQTCLLQEREISWFFGVKNFPLKRVFRQRFFAFFLTLEKIRFFDPSSENVILIVKIHAPETHIFTRLLTSLCKIWRRTSPNTLKTRVSNTLLAPEKSCKWNMGWKSRKRCKKCHPDPQKGLQGATKKEQKGEKPGKTHHFCKNHPSVQMEKVQNEI